MQLRDMHGAAYLNFFFPISDIFFLAEWSSDDDHSVVSAKQLAASENHIFPLTRDTP